MGKKTSKGQAKKAERKQEGERALKVQAVLKYANALTDLLQDYGPCKRFEPLKAEIAYFTSADLSPDLQDWAFNVCKANMEEMYSTAWGWNDARKRKELADTAARFLIVFQHDKAVGFVHLRFEEEDHDPVLYIWEFQLAPEVQRRGLGSFIMRVLFKVAGNLHMSKVMLTVLDDNDAALAMYRKLGYELDDTSPYLDPERPHGYQIWSKDLPEDKHVQ